MLDKWVKDAMNNQIVIMQWPNLIHYRHRAKSAPWYPCPRPSVSRMQLFMHFPKSQNPSRVRAALFYLVWWRTFCSDLGKVSSQLQLRSRIIISLRHLTQGEIGYTLPRSCPYTCNIVGTEINNWWLIPIYYASVQQ